MINLGEADVEGIVIERIVGVCGGELLQELVKFCFFT